MKSFVYLVRREMWENRSIWLTPLAMAAIIVLAYIAGVAFVYFHGGQIGLGDYAMAGPGKQREVLSGFLVALIGLFNLVLIITIIRYLLHSLYADRKDRSILFWRSLPLSDTATVLSKLTVAMLIAPLATFAFIWLTQLLGIGAISAIIAMAGGNVAKLVWEPAGLGGVWAFTIVGLLIQSLWYLPFYGWLMMASSWARQAPVLWAAIPPLVAGTIEAIVFQSSRFFDLIATHAQTLLTAPMPMIRIRGPHDIQIGRDSLRPAFSSLGGWIGSQAMWIGVAIGIVFIVAAIFIRRRRDEA